MFSYISFGFFSIVIALFGSSIAAYFDVKTTDVPDFIAIYMAIAGVTINAIQSYLTGNNTYIIGSLIVGGIFTAIGALKYYTRLWGGADFLLFGAIGFLIPRMPSTFVTVSAPWPYPVTLVFNIMIIGAIYSIIYSVLLAIRTKGYWKLFLNNFRKSRKTLILGLILYFGLVFILSGATSIITSIPFTFIFIGFLQKFILYFIALIFLTVFLQTIQFDILNKKIRTTHLKEGDVLSEKVILRKKIIPANKIIGLTKEQVKQIKQEKRFIKITQGVPYIPIFPIAIIVTFFFGDIIYILLPIAGVY